MHCKRLEELNVAVEEYTAQLESITEGQAISYELIESRGRTAAGNLRLI
jgi:cold shock CspA family protein